MDYTCGTANGLPVCRAPSGIPLFTHVLVILEENMSLATVQGGTGIPYLNMLFANEASSSNYTGASHPSLPNYIALTSGETVTSIDCDCQPTGTACTGSTCNIFSSSCACPQTTRCIADDSAAANLNWRNYAETMGTACNVTSAGSYATKHVPFLYYPQIETDAGVCNAGVVDYSSFATDLAGTLPAFSFISPNLTDDGHDPAFPLNGNTNIVDIDTWLSAQLPPILTSTAYTNGGLVVVVWDEGDDSLGNNPLPILVISPYAKSGGYVSSVAYNHYGLLATFEDGLGLPRLGQAATSTPLQDFFPAN